MDLTLTEAEIQARREYARQWRKNNPDKVRAQEKRRWQKAAQRMAEQAAQDKQEGNDGQG